MSNIRLKNVILIYFKNKTISTINLLGLSVGIAACIFILLLVQFEKSFDNFHQNADQIYRLRFTDSKNGDIELDGTYASPPMGAAFKDELPEIKEYVRFFPQDEMIIEVNEKKFEEKKICYVDSNYFNIFSTELLSKNNKSCLVKPNTAVLSESIAKKYYGNKNPVGKTFLVNNNQLFEVTGVYKDIPENSHFHFDILLSFDSPNWLNESYSDTWDMLFTATYFLIDKDVDIKELGRKASEIANNHKPESYKNNNWEISFQPLKKIHLHTDFGGGFEKGGNAKMNNILTIAAFVILILAWLNYISMSSAQSLDRAKEIGIKKVVGCHKNSLISDFLVEALAFNFIALMIALGIVMLLKPSFSELLNVDLSFNYWSYGFVGLLLFIFILGILLSNIYPALVMSSFNPLHVLKGKIGISAGKGYSFRKILLGFQFSISILLIFITLIIYLQTKNMLSLDMGINIENTLVVKGAYIPVKDSLFVNKVENFKQALMQLPEVKCASNSSTIPANGGFVDGVYSDIQQEEEKHQLIATYVDYNYFNSFNIKPVEGRLFSKDFPSDLQAAVISKTAVNALGFEKAEDALNHLTNRDFGDKNKHIIGVINDYQIGSWKNKSAPMIFYLDPFEKTYFVINLNKNITQKTISKIENKWKEFFGDEIFLFFDLGESYKELYKNEVRTSKVLGLFAILGVFVACIGLWGLSYFTITNRTKEIGIRKVLGSTPFGIVKLINKSFMEVVLISSFIATPIAWWLGHMWLQDYATRINMAWWLAIVPFLIVAVITILTISFYTFKMALVNPSKAIRYE